MDNLIARLNVIHKVCEEERKKEEDLKKLTKLDDFDQLRKQISIKIREIRSSVEERNSLFSNYGNNVLTVKMSASIRLQIKNTGLLAKTLSSLLEKDQAKLNRKRSKGKNITQFVKLLQERAEVVELVYHHLLECSNLERRVTDYNGSFSYNAKTGVTKLPDIDQTLTSNDKIIVRFRCLHAYSRIKN
jgi:hypothetical protein